MEEGQISWLSALLFLSQIHHSVVSQCSGGGYEASELGWKLQGHTYKRIKTGIGLECAMECQKEETCQSLNFVLSVGICELNDRTKEARPMNFVPDMDAYYFKRVLNRGKHFSVSYYRSSFSLFSFACFSPFTF